MISGDEQAADQPGIDPEKLAVTLEVLGTLQQLDEEHPDFPKPADEAAWIKDQLNAEVLMVPEAGHYPQSQQPELVGPAVVAFLKANVA